MNFKKATDELLAGITLEDVAETLGVSVQAVRQARAAEGTTAHRSPPPGWQAGVARLANKRATQLSRLAAKIKQKSKKS